jgi:hypothetical protein
MAALLLLDRRLSIGGKDGQDRLMMLRSLVKKYKSEIVNGNLLDNDGNVITATAVSTITFPTTDTTLNPLQERVDRWD